MDTLNPPALGTLLRRFRVAAGLTQDELAERAGVSKRSISDLERGIARKPHKDTVALLARVLDLSPADQAAFIAAARRPVVSAPADAIPEAAVAPFVGRARELALLDRHLVGDGPPVLLLAGEPGIGKSRLLHAAIPRAVGAGWHVLTGGCQRRDGQGSFEPLTTALARHLHRGTTARTGVDLRGCAWLVRLLPEVAAMGVDPLPAWSVEPEQERRLLFLAVKRFLTNVAGPAGVLLVLDDLQWAGADALDLLATLARSAREVPLRIVGAYRDTEVQARDPLATTLTDLIQGDLAARRLLRPLTFLEAEQLLDGLLEHTGTGPDARRQVLQRTGGVPFFLVSCAQGLRQGEEDGDREIAPWNVAQSVRQRVAFLPDAARHILGIAAVIGRTVPHGLLRSVAARPEQEVLAALDAACHAHLLAEEGATAYRFVHDVIREVVEADQGTARRMLLHRDIALALEALAGQASAAELAYHHARSDQPERAVPYLERAAARAWLAAAHQEAASLLAQAIELAQRVGRDDLLSDLHARRGKALFHLTRMAEARGEMEAALASPAPPSQERQAEILIDMALASYWQSDAASTRRHGNAALTLAAGIGREDLEVAALGALVMADSSDGEHQVGLDRYRQAATRAGAQFPAAAAPGIMMAASMFYWLADFENAIRWAEEAITFSRAAHDTSTLAAARGNLGMALMGSGRYAEALRVLMEAERESAEQGAVKWLTRSTAIRGGLHLDLGDFAVAEALAEEAREISRAVGWMNALASTGIDLLLN